MLAVIQLLLDRFDSAKPPIATVTEGSRRDCRFARRRARGKTGEVSIGPQLAYENDSQALQMLCHGREKRPAAYSRKQALGAVLA